MDGAGADVIEQLVRLLISWGALPWWAVVLAAALISFVLVGRSRGWFKVEPVDPNMIGGDPNIVTGEPQDLIGGSPDPKTDGSGGG